MFFYLDWVTLIHATGLTPMVPPPHLYHVCCASVSCSSHLKPSPLQIKEKEPRTLPRWASSEWWTPRTPLTSACLERRRKPWRWSLVTLLRASHPPLLGLFNSCFNCSHTAVHFELLTPFKVLKAPKHSRKKNGRIFWLLLNFIISLRNFSLFRFLTDWQPQEVTSCFLCPVYPSTASCFQFVLEALEQAVLYFFLVSCYCVRHDCTHGCPADHCCRCCHGVSAPSFLSVCHFLLEVAVNSLWTVLVVLSRHHYVIIKHFHASYVFILFCFL